MKVIDLDWKEAFYMLALLVISGRMEAARQYVWKVAGRPTVEVG